MGKNIAIIILSLLLLISLAGNALLGASLAMFNFASLTMGTGMYGISSLSITENYPRKVSNGDAFTITLDITNTGSTAINVEEIDISGDLNDGFRVDRTDPPTATINDHHTAGMGGFVEYMFHHALPAGQTQTFTFHCTATQAGSWTGSLDVYDASYMSENRFISIEVE
jgi:hypothetical protein